MRHVHDVAILGAGFGGLGMAVRLKARGEDSFIILEKADRPGGTWRDNTYPGAACDVQSHLYWFSFDEPPDWSHVYCHQPEILGNVERLIERHGLAPHIRYGAGITTAHWDDAAALWRIRTAGGDEYRARVFVTAWGQLNRPSSRGIGGRESFRGVLFHSSRWGHDADLTGQRVACIGNGASAVQFIPRIAPVVAHLSVFQRSANYVVPRLDRPYTAEERRRFQEDRSLYAASREGF